MNFHIMAKTKVKDGLNHDSQKKVSSKIIELKLRLVKIFSSNSPNFEGFQGQSNNKITNIFFMRVNHSKNFKSKWSHVKNQNK